MVRRIKEGREEQRETVWRDGKADRWVGKQRRGTPVFKTASNTVEMKAQGRRYIGEDKRAHTQDNSLCIYKHLKNVLESQTLPV